MITLFSVPCGFVGYRNIIQRNALNTWIRLRPRPEIILLGNDPGVAEAAREFDCIHIPDVAVSPRGRPILNDVFTKAGKASSNGLLCWMNADMMFLHLSEAIIRCGREFGSDFLMVGGRVNVQLDREWAFGQGWEEELCKFTYHTGRRHGLGGMDYFAFRNGDLFKSMLDFYVGVPYWDNWTLAYALTQVPVVDATLVVAAIHQEHERDARHGYESKTGYQDEWDDYKHNEDLFKKHAKYSRRADISDATWVLDDEELYCNVKEGPP
jgi:hypothetical protein